jgi:dihydrofolate reductase
MKLSIVAAVAENGVIGADGGMPWHYPADLRHFKQTTVGHPVIMGRKTYESIEARLGGPLPDRTNIVLSRQDSPDFPDGVIHATDADAALEDAKEALDPEQRTVYVIGGAAVYEAYFDRADELIVTEIPDAPDGDVRFPEIGPEWEPHHRETAGELTFVTYRRRPQ